jgi:hypothetical protein
LQDYGVSGSIKLPRHCEERGDGVFYARNNEFIKGSPGARFFSCMVNSVPVSGGAGSYGLSASNCQYYHKVIVFLGLWRLSGLSMLTL